MHSQTPQSLNHIVTYSCYYDYDYDDDDDDDDGGDDGGEDDGGGDDSYY